MINKLGCFFSKLSLFFFFQHTGELPKWFFPATACSAHTVWHVPANVSGFLLSRSVFSRLQLSGLTEICFTITCCSWSYGGSFEIPVLDLKIWWLKNNLLCNIDYMCDGKKKSCISIWITNIPLASLEKQALNSEYFLKLYKTEVINVFLYISSIGSFMILFTNSLREEERQS